MINDSISLPCADASMISYIQYNQFIYYFKINKGSNEEERHIFTLCKYDLNDKKETEVECYQIPVRNNN